MDPVRSQTSVGASPARGVEARAEVADAGVARSDVDARAVFERLRPDFEACYAAGKRSTPEMTAGRVTLHADIAASGQVSCAVPSDDTGLTREVEDCMRARLLRERLPGPGGVAVPVVVKDDVLAFGELRTNAKTIETVESHGLGEDVYPVVQERLPDLYACVQGVARAEQLRIVYVGGTVGPGGEVTCAVTSSATPLSVEARACVSDALRLARFRPPKRGEGLVTVPLNILASP